MRLAILALAFAGAILAPAFHAPALLGALLTLELEGVVARLPGGLYQRLSAI